MGCGSTTCSLLAAVRRGQDCRKLLRHLRCPPSTHCAIRSLLTQLAAANLAATKSPDRPPASRSFQPYVLSRRSCFLEPTIDYFRCVLSSFASATAHSTSSSPSFRQRHYYSCRCAPSIHVPFLLRGFSRPLNHTARLCCNSQSCG